jgi:hypothetical protein
MACFFSIRLVAILFEAGFPISWRHLSTLHKDLPTRKMTFGTVLPV